MNEAGSWRREPRQDHAIQFFPDSGAPSVVEDVMASQLSTLYIYIVIALLPRELCVLARSQAWYFAHMLYGYVTNLRQFCLI